MRCIALLLFALGSQSCVSSVHAEVEKIILHEVTTSPVQRIQLTYMLPAPIGDVEVVGVRSEDATRFAELSIGFGGKINAVPAAVLSCITNPDLNSLSLIYEDYSADSPVNEVWMSLGVEFYVNNVLNEADFEFVGGSFSKQRVSVGGSTRDLESISDCNL